MGRPARRSAAAEVALLLALAALPARGLRAVAAGRGEAVVPQSIADMISRMVEEQLPVIQENISEILANSQDPQSDPFAADANANASQGQGLFNLSAALSDAPLALRQAVDQLRADNAALWTRLRLQATTTATPTTTTHPRLWHGPPPPPPCAAPPRELTSGDVRMGLAPFKPTGAVGNASKKQDGAFVWRLRDGGWAFQYPDMLAHVEKDGRTVMAWAKQRYAVEMRPDGVSYHKGGTVVHRAMNGSVVFHYPTGTIHQEGNTVIYHWCFPNLIIYHTPNGIVYYDNDGMTYRGNGIAHYAPSGDVLYQGIGGITHLFPNGAITHWTKSGAIFQHPDGVTYYTPVGESEPRVLPVEDLGRDPFPGPPLTMEQVLDLARQAGPPTLPPPPSTTVATTSTCPRCAYAPAGPQGDIGFLGTPPPLPPGLVGAAVEGK